MSQVNIEVLSISHHIKNLYTSIHFFIIITQRSPNEFCHIDYPINRKVKNVRTDVEILFQKDI